VSDLRDAADKRSIEPSMAREDIVGLFARRSAAWTARDSAALAATHAVRGVVVSPTGGVLEGRDEIERVYRVWLSAFPDLQVKSEELIIDGDRVVEIAHLSGTHAGEFFGAAPSGRRVAFAAAIVVTIQNGEVTHERRILDFTGVLVQIGVLKAKPM
jgi:predicted ester cyclase